MANHRRDTRTTGAATAVSAQRLPFFRAPLSSPSKVEGVAHRAGGVCPTKKRSRSKNVEKMKDFRRDLRHNLTVAEAALWKLLKGRNFAGLQFRRQFSIDDYILDFYCPQLKLAVELDGNYHHFSGHRIADANRDKHLWDNYGIKTLRFENKTVFEHQWVITNSLLHELEQQTIKGQEPGSSPSKVEGVAHRAGGVCPTSDTAGNHAGFTHSLGLTATPPNLGGEFNMPTGSLSPNLGEQLSSPSKVEGVAHRAGGVCPRGDIASNPARSNPANGMARVERKYSQELGFYEPNLFHLHIGEHVKLDDWRSWTDAQLCTFLHEYIHFLQDVGTTAGLHNIYACGEFLAMATNQIYRQNASPEFQVPIEPDPNSGDNVDNNLLVHRHTEAYSRLNDNEAACFQVTGKAVIDTQNAVTVAHVVMPRVTVPTGCTALELGSYHIAESMAWLAEQIAYPRDTQSPPNYPYRVVEQLAAHYHIPCNQDKEFLFALCDFSLNFSHPAKVMVQFLQRFEDEKPADWRAELQDYVDNGMVADQDGHRQNYRQELEKFRDNAIQSLDGRFNNPTHAFLNAWYRFVISTIGNHRAANFFFLLDMLKQGELKGNYLFQQLMDDIGTPLLTNANNEGYFYNCLEPSFRALWVRQGIAIGSFDDFKAFMERSVSLMWAAGAITAMLNEQKQRHCPLKGYCDSKNDNRTTVNCFSSPWLNARQQSTMCPYAWLWHGWGLANREPKWN